MLRMIPHSRPLLPGPEEWAGVTSRLAPGWIADGPCLERFETEAAAWLGGSGGVAVNSGTSALHLALLAVGVTPGSEVLVPAYCCAALLNAVRLAEAVPVLVDCVRGGFNLCPEDAARRKTPRTRAVVVAHLFGRPAPLAPFLDLSIPVVEDCAQSLGASEEGALTGTQGAVCITSFYATKVITTGQGGLVSSADPERLASVRDRVEYDHRDDWQPRFNYRMSELQAALGLWQLERLPDLLARRRELARSYDRTLATAGVQSPEAPPGDIRYRYWIRVPSAEKTISAFRALGVGAARPVHRPLHHYVGGECPHSEAAHHQLVSLPLYPALTDAEAERVQQAAVQILADGGAPS